METLIVPFIFCSVLTLVGGSPVAPVNITSSRLAGLCHYIRDQTNHVNGEFIPKCDIYGNFQPQQCWAATGSCWCVNILTGQEVPNTRTLPGTTPVNCYSEFYCPDGWSFFGGQCFIFIDHAITWVEAETHCLFEGANLASVHSYEQNHFIQALIRGEGFSFTQTWIGGHNLVNHHVWLWSDGSKFNYENWNKYDDQEQKNSCLMMNYGYEYKWFPYPCNETLPFVCVKTTSA